MEQSLSDWWDSILIVTVQSRVETNRIGYLRTDCQISVCQRRTLNREKRTSKESKELKTYTPSPHLPIKPSGR